MTAVSAARAMNACGGGPTNFIANRPTRITAPQAAPTSGIGRGEWPKSPVTIPPSQTTSATSTTYRTASIQIIIISGLQTRPLAELQRIADRVVDAVGRQRAVSPDVLTFLLRCYRATDAAPLRDALEPALALGLELRKAASTCRERAAWLGLFTEAAALSPDERLLDAIADLVPALRREWTGCRIVGDLATAIDACLNVIGIFDPRDLAAKAIDELEHLIAAAYRPGDGLAHDLDSPDLVRGQLADQLRAASALLTAYVLTWRLPYGMLAEELVLFARRTRWDDDQAAFRTDEGGDGFALNCEAARVLCRLASLHHDDDYRHVAVVAVGADYHADAERILTAQALSAHDRDLADAAAYGLALAEFSNLPERA